MERTKKKKKKKKEKKRKRRRKQRSVVLEGVPISGVERTGVFAAGGKRDAEHKNKNQDDYILSKLFKKSAVHSAIHHDSIMSSGDSDYVLVEAEAKKVAQSAARALRESRRQCLEGGWGRVTWTGQHGGTKQPRFGAVFSTRKSTQTSLQQHFNGQTAGASLLPSSSSSAATSSSHLLAKMRRRNAHSLPPSTLTDIHQTAHGNLLKEIRDFIATQCRVDGQATTEELLTHFSSKLSNSDTATFRSMLREICDFARIHGDGRWILKAQFR